jgi:hypothetical protein
MADVGHVSRWGDDPSDADRPSDDLVDVAGVPVSAGIAEPTAPRPRVVIVADSWGSDWGERAAATRLVAGALALRASVSVVSIEDLSDQSTQQPPLRYDGVFPVYSISAPADRGDSVGAHGRRDDLLRSDLLRASFMRQPGRILPELAAESLLEEASLPSTDAFLKMVSLEPDVVILAGPATFWMGRALAVDASRPRVVLLPLCGDDPVLSSSAFRAAVAPVDAIGAFSGSEFDRVLRHLEGAAISRLHHLEIALPVNRLAASAGMAGLRPFGRYVLVISAFDDDWSSGRCPPHEYLRHVLGHVSIAEVKRPGWVVTSADGQRFDIPWAATRMNLWRLMAGAEMTVDVRSPGPIGREAVESLRFGTPVVVPSDSVAAEHARQSNGGLWYRNPGEMVDCARALLDDESLRARLGASGAEWAEQHHGDMESFVEGAIRLALGSPAELSTPRLQSAGLA